MKYIGFCSVYIPNYTPSIQREKIFTEEFVKHLRPLAIIRACRMECGYENGFLTKWQVIIIYIYIYIYCALWTLSMIKSA